MSSLTWSGEKTCIDGAGEDIVGICIANERDLSRSLLERSRKCYDEDGNEKDE